MTVKDGEDWSPPRIEGLMQGTTKQSVGVVVPITLVGRWPNCSQHQSARFKKKCVGSSSQRQRGMDVLY